MEQKRGWPISSLSLVVPKRYKQKNSIHQNSDAEHHGTTSNFDSEGECKFSSSFVLPVVKALLGGNLLTHLLASKAKPIKGLSIIHPLQCPICRSSFFRFISSFILIISTYLKPRVHKLKASSSVYFPTNIMIHNQALIHNMVRQLSNFSLLYSSFFENIKLCYQVQLAKASSTSIFQLQTPFNWTTQRTLFHFCAGLVLSV